MSIVGVSRLIYGVDNLDDSVRFYEDFGLPLAHRDDQQADFTLMEGSTVSLRPKDDPTLPEPVNDLSGVREVVWGVDTKAALNAIAEDLSRDRNVRWSEDGTLHTRDDQGIAIGFEVFQRKPIRSDGSEENGLAEIRRWNSHRKWFQRAEPKLIHHAVFAVPDVDAAVAFYVDRLHFRISDISRGLGVFMRCDGRNDHHNLFFLRSDQVRWLHVSFGVENIDELMTGAVHMQRQGWKSDLGLGRHRISSTIFYYCNNPAGGQSEYSADTDYLTDDWRPRLWEPRFGNWHWVASVPDAFQAEPEWDVRVLEEPIPSFSELSAGATKGGRRP